MTDDTQPFTEKELEALAREHGKPVREGFENDVLQKIRSLRPEKESSRRNELENTADSADQEASEKDLEM